MLNLGGINSCTEDVKNRIHHRLQVYRARVIVAYWLGQKHGEANCIKFFERILDKTAMRLGVPSDHDYWSDEGFYKWLLEMGAAMKRNRETERRSERN